MPCGAAPPRELHHSGALVFESALIPDMLLTTMLLYYSSIIGLNFFLILPMSMINYHGNMENTMADDHSDQDLESTEVNDELTSYGVFVKVGPEDMDSDDGTLTDIDALPAEEQTLTENKSGDLNESDDLTEEEERLLGDLESQDMSLESDLAAFDLDSFEEDINLSFKDNEQDVFSEMEDPGVMSEMEDLGITSEMEEPEVMSEIEDPGVMSEIEDLGITSEMEDPGVMSEMEDLGITSEMEDLEVTSEVKDPGVMSEMEDEGITSEMEDEGIMGMSSDLESMAETESEVNQFSDDDQEPDLSLDQFENKGDDSDDLQIDDSELNIDISMEQFDLEEDDFDDTDLDDADLQPMEDSDEAEEVLQEVNLDEFMDEPGQAEMETEIPDLPSPASDAGSLDVDELSEDEAIISDFSTPASDEGSLDLDEISDDEAIIPISPPLPPMRKVWSWMS